MILSCPSCGAKFKVDSALIGESGRSVRCGNCGHSWQQMPLDRKAESTVEGEPDEDIQAAAAVAAEKLSRSKHSQTLDKLDEQRRRSQRRAAVTTQKSEPSRVAGWVLLGLFVLVLLAGLVVGREQIVALAPATAPVYETLGLEEMIGEGLDLRDVTSVRRVIDGERTLIVRGVIVNLTDQPQPVPRLQASLTDGSGAEVTNWAFDADSSDLPPGGITTFQTTTRDPPREGDVSLVFIE